MRGTLKLRKLANFFRHYDTSRVLRLRRPHNDQPQIKQIADQLAVDPRVIGESTVSQPSMDRRSTANHPRVVADRQRFDRGSPADSVRLFLTGTVCILV